MPGRTGPRSAAGKAKVAQNAVKHGLRASKWMSPEEQESFSALADDLHAEYQPNTATQRILVERIAMCMSKLRRLHHIEDTLFYKARIDDVRSKLDRYPNATPLTIEQTVSAAMPPFKFIEVLGRYQTTLDRQLSKSIGELMILKANEKITSEGSNPTVNSSGITLK